MSGPVEVVVSLKKLSIVCVIGDLPHERITEQTIEVDIDIGLRDATPCLSDSLSDSVDYTSVADLCLNSAREGKFRLIEALAYELAKSVLTNFSVPWVRVKVCKPSPCPHLGASTAELLMKEVDLPG